MYSLQRAESTDSLSAWSPFKCVRDEHAQRYFFSDAAKQRKLSPPTCLDRTVLDQVFRWLSKFQLTDCKEEPRTTTNGYRAENACLKRAIKVIEIKKDYKVTMERENKKLNREFTALRNESVRILFCSGDRQTNDKWRLIADSVQAYLTRVRQFFDCQLLYINSMASTWPLRNRTLALEKLKKLYTCNVSRMDEWIETVVNA
ncbi:uncharacterized protein LOC113554802 [Rhopalosiphum maidis]|uniref:uncharacterized protein LOC113554802 n=1 Tax=Rhopalosiphum maidis TaxID=43146 RepID=UPI000EFFE571|nr:uncharacterized protein LOC113554802 [Rhopalosiphum maidis]